jgi:hypothetical protein
MRLSTVTLRSRLAQVRERARCHENARRLLRCDAVFVRNLTVVCQDRLGTDAENDERMLSQNPGGVRYVFGIWHLAAAAKQLRGATVRRIDETHANPLAAWIKMGAPDYTTTAQNAAIMAASEMVVEKLVDIAVRKRPRAPAPPPPRPRARPFFPQASL